MTNLQPASAFTPWPCCGGERKHETTCDQWPAYEQAQRKLDDAAFSVLKAAQAWSQAMTSPSMAARHAAELALDAAVEAHARRWEEWYPLAYYNPPRRDR